MKKISIIVLSLVLALVAFHLSKASHEPTEKEIKKETVKVEKKTIKVEQPVKTKEEPKPEVKRIDWNLPSGGNYPVLTSDEKIWIHVSKADQKVYFMNGDKIIYTMICSTGLDENPDNSTPEGTFYIQGERGLSFYNGREKMGAKYWVSWKDHGVFLFHSVATDINGNVIPTEADKLGHKASHGCVRLTMPDAKWIYDNIPTGTKVVIGQ